MTSYNQGDRFYVGEFDETFDQMLLTFVEKVDECVKRLSKKSPPTAPHITIFINSEGGDASRAWALVELMEWAKAEGVVVATVVLHSALSAASLVAVAGSKGYRYTTPSAEYMVHYGSSESVVTSPKGASNLAKAQTTHFVNMRDMFAANTKLAGGDEGVMHLLLVSDTYLTATEAIENGLADQYL